MVRSITIDLGTRWLRVEVDPDPECKPVVKG